MAREYHVAKHGNDKNKGTYESPFLTISKAAKLADEGDTVIVHEGEYREWVKPVNGARTNNHRITYTAAEGEKVRVNLPMPLIKATLECASGIKLNGLMGGSSGVLDNIDFAQIIKIVESGLIGKIVEVDDGEGTTVEIVVE